MNIFRQVKTILCLFLAFISFYTEGKGSWETEVDIFFLGKVQPLRDSRLHLKRSIIPFTKTVEILDYIEEGKQKYGQAAIASSSHTAELIIDVCDIVNLQHPDFKTRYDIFIEQWEGHTQFPFSLFSFDRIAQVFHYRSTLFNEASGSAYQQMIEKIVDTELPILRNTFKFICNLHDANSGTHFLDPNYTIYLKEINASLDAAQKEIRKKIPNSRMKGLSALSAMAHDYLTLGRIEDAIRVTLSIPEFTQRLQREAFLASMIQIGELSTNKNLSSFVRQYMPSIPWEDLVHCRDAIEHQDEHGFNAYFENLLQGHNNTVNFKDWQDELKILAQVVFDVKQQIWKNDPSSIFDIWLQKELTGQPLYGVVVERPKCFSIKEFNNSIKNGFRKTPLFNGNKKLWGGLTSGMIRVAYDHIESLKNEIATLKTSSLNSLPPATVAQNQKFLQAYEGIEAYLWDRLRRESIYLSDAEISGLIDTSKNYFSPNITKFCIALLNKDQTYLTLKNYKLFETEMLSQGLNSSVIFPIFKRFYPQLTVTRQICSALPFDNSKDLQQTERRNLAQDMFVRTAEYLHILAHDEEFIKGLFVQLLLSSYEYGYKLIESNIANLDNETKEKFFELNQTIVGIQEEHGIKDESTGEAKFSGVGLMEILNAYEGSRLIDPFEIQKTNGFRDYYLPMFDEIFAEIHKINLPVAIRNNPVTYLASVYTLSVGVGALKEWVLRDPQKPKAESTIVEKLRDGRNFIAHGDLFRIMNSINLADIQENLLTDHLEHCAVLKFIQ